MAISLARGRRVGQQRTTGKRLAKEYGAQQKKAQKRKGISGLLGKGFGSILGTGLVGALGLTGFGVPLAMALGSMAGKKGAHELTRGMGAKTGELKGDMYGYGEDAAMSLKKDLESQMAVDPLKERGGFGKELLSSTVSAGLAGDLGGATKSLIKGDVGGAFVDPEATKGWAGAKESLAGLIPGYSDAASKAVDPSTIGLESSLEGSGLDLEQYNSMVDTAQANYMDDDTWDDETVTESPEYQGLFFEQDTGPLSPQWEGAQGGQVPQQQQLMQLLALMSQQQEQTAYSGTALQEEKQPSIAEHFASQGKTLGGNNTQSLSQKLGR